MKTESISLRISESLCRGIDDLVIQKMQNQGINERPCSRSSVVCWLIEKRLSGKRSKGYIDETFIPRPKSILVKVSPELLARIKEAKSPLNSVSTYVRDAIDREIRAIQTKSKTESKGDLNA